MTARPEDYDAALDVATREARAWLASVPDRPVAPRAPFEAVRDSFGTVLPEGPTDPAAVVAELADLVEPGLMAIQSGRFYGWVMGGVLPAALAADWLVSAWDQNAGLRFATPGAVAAEDAAARWLLELLGLPPTGAVGFVTGGTMANFTCLTAARDHVLARAGWDVGRDGLHGAPPVRVLVGEDRHVSVDVALRYLGLGAPEPVAADDQGRLDTDALTAALGDGPAIVCLQAGNLHSGAFDPIGPAVAAAREHGAWVHVDGAFGLWAAASPALQGLVGGLTDADSWATDAHKTLNVPYDCGVAIVAQREAMHAALGVQAAYLVPDADRDPLDRVPEMSRRARGVPVWAALRSLGRSGVAELVDGLVAAAQGIAARLGEIRGVEVLNDVVFTQVSFAVGDDARTAAVAAHLMASGETWMSGSRWRDRAIVRVSVSNWATDAEDVARSVAAVRQAVEATG